MRDPRSGNGGVALYRSSGGPLSLDPRVPFSCRPGQSQVEPPGARQEMVLWSASSWPSFVAASASTHTFPYSGDSYSPGVRTEYKAELALVGHEAAELTIAKYMHRR